jgi:quinol monooxygenase YgiN
MGFVQIIECRTSRLEEIQQLEDQWRAATEGKRTLRRSIVTRDRNDPQRVLVLAFFDDYDSAMANSNLPETSEFGARQAALCDAPMAFTDLDIVDDREG